MDSMDSSDAGRGSDYTPGSHPLLRRIKLACSPLFVLSLGDLSVEISEVGCPTPERDTSLRLEVRRATGEVVWFQEIVLAATRHHRLAMTLPCDLALDPGSYTVAATPADIDLFAMQDFVVTEQGFPAAADKLREALLLHSEAMRAARQRRFDAVLAPLQRAAELFAEADALECAVAAWRDVASYQVIASNRLHAEHACRKALWIALVNAYEATSGSVMAGLKAATRSDPPAVSGLCLARRLPVTLSDVWELVSEVREVRHPLTFLMPAFHRDEGLKDRLKRLLIELTALGQADDVFQTILRSQLSDPDLTDAAYLCLSAIDGSYALTMLPQLGNVAVYHNRHHELRPILAQALAELDLSVIYGYLPYVARQMSEEALAFVIPTVLQTRPVDAIILDDEWLLYEPGDLDAPIATIPNEDPWALFLSPHFARATFDDARLAVEAVA